MGTCAYDVEENTITRKINKAKLTAMKRKQTLEEARDREDVYRTFDKFDLDQDGYLNMGEILNFVKHSYNKKGKDSMRLSDEFITDRAEKLIEKVDCNGDRKISREDFYYFYKKS